MKINFFRIGHANNSSSSHSLIFTSNPETFYNTENTHFGWDLFTCSNIEAKKNYIYACLKTSYRRVLNITYNYSDDISYEDVEFFIDKMFHKWIDQHFSEFKFDTSNTDDIIVDHQSEIIFPIHRNEKKGINKQLAKSIINEFLKPNYIVLGGNDNDDTSHPGVDKNENDKLKLPLITLWYMCKDVYQLPMAEYDENTNEYVISNGKSGSLLKITI
jgi:hypothetical protein